MTTLTSDLFSTTSANGLQIKHLQFSNSNVQMLKDNSLINLKDSLESLSIVNGKLTNVSKQHWLPIYHLDISWWLSEICNYNINYPSGMEPSRSIKQATLSFSVDIDKFRNVFNAAGQCYIDRFQLHSIAVSSCLLFITRHIKLRNLFRAKGKLLKRK